MFAPKQLSLFFIFLSLASSHFLLHYPDSIGFDDDNEGESPCGGFDVPSADSTNGTSIPVGGFPIFLQSTHPQATWLMRASMDRETTNWTNILPVITQTGTGDFCLPALTLPDTFVGKTGVIQVLQDAVDGILYQCAAVTFVSGTNTSVSCDNATSLTATITNQQSFNTSDASSSAASTATSMSATSSMSMTTTTAAASAAATSSGAEAALVAPYAGVGMLGLVWGALAVLL